MSGFVDKTAWRNPELGNIHNQEQRRVLTQYIKDLMDEGSIDKAEMKRRKANGQHIQTTNDGGTRLRMRTRDGSIDFEKREDERTQEDPMGVRYRFGEVDQEKRTADSRRLRV